MNQGDYVATKYIETNSYIPHHKPKRKRRIKEDEEDEYVIEISFDFDFPILEFMVEKLNECLDKIINDIKRIFHRE